MSVLRQRSRGTAQEPPKSERLAKRSCALSINWKRDRTQNRIPLLLIASNLPIGLPAAPGGLPTNIPTGVGVGASGTIYFSSNIENAIYKVAKK
jgi:hypothetical protein